MNGIKPTDPKGEKIREWARKTAQSARRHCEEGGIYYGIDGARIFARSCGYALADFAPCTMRHFDDTYLFICPVAYAHRPPVNRAQWRKLVEEGYNAEMERRREEKKGASPV